MSPFKFQVLTLARSPEAVAELANTPSSQVFQDSGLKIQAYISFFFKTFFIDQSTFISFEMDPFQELQNEFSSTIQALWNEIESIKHQPVTDLILLASRDDAGSQGRIIGYDY